MSTHQWEGNLDRTAEAMGFILTGKSKECLHCARAKMKQKKMNKIEQGGNFEPGTRVAMDMTSSKTKSLGGKNIAHVIIDYDTNMLFVSLLKKKSEGVEDGLELLEEIKAKKGKGPDYVRLDQSGENKKLRDTIKRRFPETKIEFTARGTPQQNGRVERAIATIWNRVRAMLDGAGIHGEKRE